MTEPPLPRTDETLDVFAGGTLRILQKKTGYRFSIDAVLLSQFVQIRKHEKIIDLGTGCGILPLLLSQTAKTSSFVGVEIQKELAECAVKNVSLNRLQDRISILRCDFRRLKNFFPQASFHVVLSNPPYRKERTGRMNPAQEKAIARHEISGTINDLLSVASYLLPHKGRVYLIFPSSRTVDLLVTLRTWKLEPKRVQFIHPRVGEKAKFVLVESVKSGGPEAHIHSPVILTETKNFLTLSGE